MAKTSSTKSSKTDSITKDSNIKKENEQAVSKNKPEIIAKNIDTSQYVIVRNGFQGQLIYKSPRTGEVFLWDSFGAEQEMELRELRNAKNSSKKFFINNWFMFDDDWIIDYLGVRQFYKNAISIDEFDEIFNKKPAEISKLISNLSEGQKKSVAYRATQLIAEKKIDSLAVIETLEKSLNIELIER